MRTKWWRGTLTMLLCAVLLTGAVALLRPLRPARAEEPAWWQFSACEDDGGWNGVIGVADNPEQSLDGHKQGASARIGIARSTGASIPDVRLAAPLATDLTEDNGALGLWFFIDDPAKMKDNCVLQISSSGHSDEDEYKYALSGGNLLPGWNFLELPFAEGVKSGTPNPQAMNYLRFIMDTEQRYMIFSFDDIILYNRYRYAPSADEARRVEADVSEGSILLDDCKAQWENSSGLVEGEYNYGASGNGVHIMNNKLTPKKGKLDFANADVTFDFWVADHTKVGNNAFLNLSTSGNPDQNALRVSFRSQLTKSGEWISVRIPLSDCYFAAKGEFGLGDNQSAILGVPNFTRGGINYIRVVMEFTGATESVEYRIRNIALHNRYAERECAVKVYENGALKETQRVTAGGSLTVSAPAGKRAVLAGKTSGIVSNQAVLVTGYEDLTYRVRYDGNGEQSSLADATGLVVGAAVDLTKTLQAEGKRFLGWSLAKNGEVLPSLTLDAQVLSALTGDTLTLYAVWENEQTGGGTDFEISGGGGGMSTGAIVGIVVGAVLLVAAGALFAWYWKKRQTK